MQCPLLLGMACVSHLPKVCHWPDATSSVGERAVAGNVLYSNTLSTYQLQLRVYLTFREDCSSRVDLHSSWMHSARTTAGPTPFRFWRGFTFRFNSLSLLLYYGLVSFQSKFIFVFVFFSEFPFMLLDLFPFFPFILLWISYSLFCFVFSTLVKFSVVWNRNTR